MSMNAIEKAIDLLGDILVDLEMTTVDPGAYIDCAKEKAKKAIAALESEKPAEDDDSIMDIFNAIERHGERPYIDDEFKFEARKELLSRLKSFARSYHLAECAKCKALPEDNVPERAPK